MVKTSSGDAGWKVVSTKKKPIPAPSTPPSTPAPSSTKRTSSLVFTPEALAARKKLQRQKPPLASHPSSPIPASVVQSDTSQSSQASELAALRLTITSIQQQLDSISQLNQSLVEENLRLKKLVEKSTANPASFRTSAPAPAPAPALSPPQTPPPSILALEVASPAQSKPSWSQLVQQSSATVSNTDKDQVVAAINKLSRLSRPSSASAPSPIPPGDALEMKHNLRRVYFKNVNRLPLRQFRTLLRTLRLQTSRISNIRFVGRYTVEFLVTPDYTTQFTSDFAKVVPGSVHLADFQQLNAPVHLATSPEQYFQQLYHRFTDQSLTSNQPNISNFFDEWGAQVLDAMKEKGYDTYFMFDEEDAVKMRRENLE